MSQRQPRPRSRTKGDEAASLAWARGSESRQSVRSVHQERPQGMPCDRITLAPRRAAPNNRAGGPQGKHGREARGRSSPGTPPPRIRHRPQRFLRSTWKRGRRTQRRNGIAPRLRLRANGLARPHHAARPGTEPDALGASHRRLETPGCSAAVPRRGGTAATPRDDRGSNCMPKPRGRPPPEPETRAAPARGCQARFCSLSVTWVCEVTDRPVNTCRPARAA